METLATAHQRGSHTGAVTEPSAGETREEGETQRQGIQQKHAQRHDLINNSSPFLFSAVRRRLRPEMQMRDGGVGGFKIDGKGFR